MTEQKKCPPAGNQGGETKSSVAHEYTGVVTDGQADAAGDEIKIDDDTVPQGVLVEYITRKYLNGLDPSDPPCPRMVQCDLRHRINNRISVANIIRDETDKLKSLKSLGHTQIAQILIQLHNVRKIVPEGGQVDPELSMIGIYCAAGPNAGVYDTSEVKLRSMARKYNHDLTTKDFKEIVAILDESAPSTSVCTDRDLIAVNNGIFDYANKTLQPFDPNIVCTSKSMVDYDPDAPNIVIHNDEDGTDWDVESWMESLSDDPEIVELLWEILGAIIRPHVRWNKSAWLYSEFGNNGKGTLCELMRNLCGPSTHTAIPISNFGKEFLLEPLIRASAIIVDENDVGTFIDKAANLKAVITNDVISINRKYKNAIAFQFWGFMVQCLNEFPRIKDKSDSFYRRQLFIPMTKNFTGQERRYIKNDYLRRPEVLRYVLKRVLHMDYYVLSEPQATKDVLSEYKEVNDPVRAFLNEFSDQFVWDIVPMNFLWDLYKAWFAQTNPSGVVMGRTNFFRDVKRIVSEGGDWRYSEDNIRSQNRMVGPEHLIDQYDLKEWSHPHYTGNDSAKRSMPLLKPMYKRCLVRCTLDAT